MIIRIISISILFLYAINNFATNLPIKPIKFQVKQEVIDKYLNSNDDTPILSQEEQEKHLKRLISHEYASKSPWSEKFVTSNLPEVLNKLQATFPLNLDETHYGFNFQNHSKQWLNNLNFQLENVHIYKSYNNSKRAIIVHNSMARKMPTFDPDYFSYTKAGQGYPFDNFQESAIFIGTPVYVVATSENQAWSFIITPDEYFAWIPSKDLAFVSQDFINRWNNLVKNSLIGITNNGYSLKDQHNNFENLAYVGMMLPGKQVNNDSFLIYIPVADEEQTANIKLAVLPQDAGTKMPMSYNLKNIAYILQQNLNRPYGWGGQYFYNDCSQELKSFFTPFGIWLPRNSSKQISQIADIKDYSELNAHDRLLKLKSNAHPWLSLIDIDGHVMLYIGEYPKKSPNSISMTYQNIWGYHDIQDKLRFVIGKSSIIPLLETIPINKDIQSQLSKEKFRWINLDEVISSANN